MENQEQLNVNDESPAGELVIPEQIENPTEYFKSQAEKFARLLAKAEKTLSETVKQKDAELSSVTSRLTEIEQAMQSEKQARFNEYKTRMLVENGLDSDLVEFLTATDEEGVKAQIAKLSEKTKQVQKAVAPRVGTSTSTQQNGKPDFLSKNRGVVGGGYVINS